MTTLTVYGFGAADELFDISPFVHKVEVYLRLASLSYEKRSGDPRRSPNRKLPYLHHGERKVADSQLIVAYLREMGLADLDEWLDPRQRALVNTLRVSLEEDFYFTLLYFRWQADQGWSVYRDVLVSLITQAGVPRLLAGVIAHRLRPGIIRTLDGQGTGRRNPDELLSRAHECLANLEALTSHGEPWLLGDRPCSLDAIVHAFLAAIRWQRVPTPLTRLLSDHPPLRHWLDHVDTVLAPG